MGEQGIRVARTLGAGILALLGGCGEVVITGSSAGGAQGTGTTTATMSTQGGAGAGGSSTTSAGGGSGGGSTATGGGTVTGGSGGVGGGTVTGGSGGVGGVTMTGGSGGVGGGTVTGGSGGVGGGTITGGSGGVGGMTMTAGGGGAGGGTTTTGTGGGPCFCVSNADCAPVGVECKQAVCASCFCQIVNVPDGTPASDPIEGDCLGRVCASGEAVLAVDDADVPDDGNDCTIEACFMGAPMGAPVPAGVPCASGAGLCDGGGDCVECLGDVDCGLMAYCAGGVCVAKTGPGTPCGSASTCLSGSCADGVCCQSACLGACKACSTAKTGQANGVCANILTGTDPDNECPGPLMCAFGSCPFEPGPCQSGAECPSGFCVDGVCCNSACMFLCQACSAVKKGGGADGTCGFIATGTDPDNECAGALVCVSGICN